MVEAFSNRYIDVQEAPAKRPSPLESRQMKEERNGRNTVKGFEAWAGVAPHPHIFPIAHVISPTVVLFPGEPSTRHLDTI